MSKAPIPDPPDIFRYADGRQFLADWWEWKKTANPRTSFRSFGQRADSSPSLLKDILEGRRRLTPEASLKFGKAMNLGDREKSYLAALATFSGARSPEARNEAFAELTRLRHQSFVRYLDPHQYAAWTWWYHMAVRELAGVSGFQEDPAWIASTLEPPIRPREASKALNELQEFELLRRDESGRLVASDPAISTEYEVPSMVVRHFNQQMIQLALTAAERIPSEQREISGLTLGLSQECYDRIKERIRMFKQEMFAMVLADQRPSTLVAQLNFQLFPLARSQGGKP